MDDAQERADRILEKRYLFCTRVWHCLYPLLCIILVVALPVVISMPLSPPIHTLRSTIMSSDTCNLLLYQIRVTVKATMRVIDIPLQIITLMMDYMVDIWRPLMLPPYTCIDLGTYNPFLLLVWLAEHRYPNIGETLRTTNTSLYLLYEIPTIKQHRASIAYANVSTLADYAICYDDGSYFIWSYLLTMFAFVIYYTIRH